MSKIGFLLCLLCAGFAERCWSFDGSNLIKGDKNYEKVVVIARKEIGVRESNCPNCGPRVEGYLAYVGVRKGSPWCAAFLSYCFGQAGYPAPKTAWSPALFPRARVVSLEMGPRNGVGLVFGIWFPELKRVAHCGLLEYRRGDWLSTIEGNTSENGGREGIGVFRRLRHRRAVHCYSDWVNRLN